jgi:hypothetical protein
MTNQHKGIDHTREPASGLPPLPGGLEKARKRKTKIEREENEDLEKDEGTEAIRGNPESPDNTGAERRMAGREDEFDDWRDYDEADPEAVEEELRNQDS